MRVAWRRLRHMWLCFHIPSPHDTRPESCMTVRKCLTLQARTHICLASLFTFPRRNTHNDARHSHSNEQHARIPHPRRPRSDNSCFLYRISTRHKTLYPRALPFAPAPPACLALLKFPAQAASRRQLARRGHHSNHL